MFRHALRGGATNRNFSPWAAPILLQSRPRAWPTYKAGFHELGGDAPHRNAESDSHSASNSSRRSHSDHILKNETIYALSSGAGRAGIAVIRVSGPGSLDVYRSLCPSNPPPKPRYAGVRTLTDPGDASGASILDSDALVLYFPGPKTVTGEDVLELHVHGGHATVKAVLSAIPRCMLPRAKIRYAEPGEFTKRAFLNGRLDLAQVESLGETLAAETEQQRRAAVRGTSGILGKAYEGWRQQLLLARAEIEALIDFSEDQHFDESPAELLTNVSWLVDGILGSIRLYRLGSQRSELLRNGIRIALLGPPNVGKSSLMNQIVGREASIVSAEAGTTRDIVEASLDIRGFLCSFADTAGIRTTSVVASSSSSDAVGGAKASSPPAAAISTIEEEGIRRARNKARDSDVIIVLASVELASDGTPWINYDTETLRLAAGAQQFIVAVNKSDVVDRDVLRNLLRDFAASVRMDQEGRLSSSSHDGDLVPLAAAAAEPPLLAISCRAAAADAKGLTDPGGIQALAEKLAQSFAVLTSVPSDMQHLLSVTERQNQLLVVCQRHLEDFVTEAARRRSCGTLDEHAVSAEPDVVLAAEHLRLAANCLASITGHGDAGDVEEVLGVIFEK
ncbi:GTP-binding protein TrmE N-terminus-domain-containing protein [Lasiosphaeria miniovina]|uniref:GTP-binding protein TrmE N-terminus-domain-containing protein n=1 Tax=Lasiosphaeria miniovina TaxID=1954250 RepID=A0AA40E9F4_9PEZI|nr:GTP-binding protein TrmE N-terminus-domain-containing protein [Lasiosphaeria miniovina]KAK0727263.1 GTP-binding protein TrmE N-terminus-domain-containing protein [Lasiosphaeria miniovina]